MRKVFFLIWAAFPLLTVSCMATYTTTTRSEYVDDLYGGDNGRTFTASRSNKTNSTNDIYYSSSSRAVEEIELSDYYPGMFEEALTGTIQEPVTNESAATTKSGSSSSSDITVNINYGWGNWYPSWYYGTRGWGVGFSWAWRDPWYSPWYYPTWGWYDPWYDPWYSPWYDPWYHPWHGPWHGYHPPVYVPRYNRYNSSYTGNRRTGTMIGNSSNGYVPTRRPASVFDNERRPSYSGDAGQGSSSGQSGTIERVRRAGSPDYNSQRYQNQNNNSVPRYDNNTYRPNSGNPVRTPSRAGGSISRGTSGGYSGGGVSRGGTSGGGVSRGGGGGVSGPVRR